MNNEQKNNEQAQPASEIVTGVETYTQKAEYRLTKIKANIKTYKVSETTAMYIHLLEELEELMESVIDVFGYEEGILPTDEEVDEIVNAFDSSRQCIRDRVLRNVDRNIWSLNITQI